MKKNLKKISLMLVLFLFTGCATISRHSVRSYEDGKIAGEVISDINHIKNFTNDIRNINKKESELLNNMSDEIDDIDKLITEIKILEKIYNEQINEYKKNNEFEKISIANEMLIKDINSRIGINEE